MEDFTIAIYCFLHGFLKLAHPKEDVNRKMNNAEILTTAIVSASYFGGNFVKGRHYMQHCHGCNMPDKSNFNRQLHKLSDLLGNMFCCLGQILKQLNISSEHIIGSFLVALCKNMRIKRCKLLENEGYRGYNRSKRAYFYGFKVQVIVTAEGIPTDYFLVAGSAHDITAFQSMNIALPRGSSLYADSAYTDYELEDYYEALEGVRLLVQRKKHAKRADSPAMAFMKKHMRKRIETDFFEMLNLFPRKVHGVTAQGFLLKVVLFICAYTFDRII